MSVARAILQFFGVNHDFTPRFMAHEAIKCAEPVAEVDDLRERYSAAKYITHLRAAMDGDDTGRGEWSRVLKNMSPDDAELFWADFDALTDAGALVHVLTAEEREQVKASIIEKLDEYRELNNGLMRDLGVPPALMHKLVSETRDARGEAFALNPARDIAAGVADADMAAYLEMEDEDLAAWAEDEETT